MKRILRKGKVRGTVLFTVTGVMLVLVVFLMSTLVLATSANRRSYYTYYETQAQYAAQAALDAVTNSAYNDGNFHTWIKDHVTETDGRMPITVDFTNSNIQFTGNYDSVNCFIEKVEPNYIWDDVTGAVHRQDAWRITAVASVGNGRNASEYSVCNYLYENFRVEDPSTLSNVMNTAQNTVHNWTDTPGGTTPPAGTPIPQASSLGAAATNNNYRSLGPQGSGLSNIPLGRINYDISPEAGSYTIDTSNDNYAVGNIKYINSVSSTVVRECQFQCFGESAIYYGNLYSGNTANGGFAWYANMSSAEVARASAGGSIAYRDLPYVYVDGTIYCNGTNPPNGAFSGRNGGCFVGYNTYGYRSGDATDYPVNLYAGAVKSGTIVDGGITLAAQFAVNGDAYLYDPQLTSEIRIAGANSTALQCFVHNNVSGSGDHYGHTGSGNLFSNNQNLIINGGRIEGDLIYANKTGTLTINAPLEVTGKVICAGTLAIQGNGSLTSGTNTILTGADDLSSYYDGMYDTYVTDSTAYANRTDETRVLPYTFRIDEICDEYTRWDLKAATEEQARNNMNADPLVAESIAAGHTWDVKSIPITSSANEYRDVVYGDPDFHDPWEWGQNGNPQKPADWVEMNGDAEHGYSHSWYRVCIGSTTTTNETWVPYTTPRAASSFVPVYTPISPSSALTSLTSYTIENASDFAAAMTSTGTAIETYNNAHKPTYVENLPVIYHDATHTDSDATALVNAYVINHDCIINLNDGYNNSVIFIDPKIGNHNSTNPLRVSFVGQNIANCNTIVIVNNTAAYASNYQDYASYREDGVYAGRGEVQIFFQDGFGAAAGAFRLCCSGAYNQMINNNWNIVANPLYPDNGTWSTIPDALKFAYELVPNVTILGEANGTFDFRNGCFINADVLIPNGTIKNINASNYAASMTYREYWDTESYSSETSSVSVGSLLVSQYDTGTNIAQGAFITDRNRGTSTPGITEETVGYDGNSNRLGQENEDYFSNNYRNGN